MATRCTLTPSRNSAGNLTSGTLEEVFQFLTAPEAETKDGPAFVPATFSVPRRKNVNVATLSALVLDLDKLTREQMTAVNAKLEALALRCWVYQTWSHAPAQDKRCYRVVLPFAEEFDKPGSWAVTRRALLAHLGFTAEADPACSDAARLYYLPRTPRGEKRAVNFQDGPCLDWRPHFVEEVSRPAKTSPAPQPRDESRPYAMQPILDALQRPSGELGRLGGRLLRGEALTPPPNRRPVGEPSRYLAWRTVTAHVANVAEDWMSSGPLLELLKPSHAAEMLDCPEDHTPFSTVEALFESARANAPQYRASKAAKEEENVELARKLIGQHTARHEAVDGPAPLASDGTAAPPEPVDENAWAKGIKWIIKKDGSLRAEHCIDNVEYILRNAPCWRNALRFNLLTLTVEVVGEPLKSDEDVARPDKAKVEPLTDAYVTRICVWLSRHCGLGYAEQTIFNQLTAIAQDNPHDPVRDMLGTLKWDGKVRLATVLEDYFGVESSQWGRIAGRRWLIGAVARAMDPGCQMDTMLVFEGEEGKRKTTAMKALAGGAWACGALMHRIEDEQALHMIHSRWLVEFGELRAMRQAEKQHVKLFVSNPVDNFRPKYGRVSIGYPRRCVFFGTTNEADYLDDPTGARRFWPVAVTTAADMRAIERDREQIWAEAVECYRRWETEHQAYEDHPDQWWLTPEEEKLARAEADKRAPSDAVSEVLDHWVARQKPERREDGFTVRELLIDCFQHEPNAITRANETRLGIGLKRSRWHRVAGRPTRYFPPDLPVKAVEPPSGPPPAVHSLTAKAAAPLKPDYPLGMSAQDMQKRIREMNETAPEAEYKPIEMRQLRSWTSGAFTGNGK